MTQKTCLAALAVAATLISVRPVEAHAQTTAPASATEENAQARSLFRQGAAAMKDGKYAEARTYLLQAWALRRTYDVAAVLGQVELELKLYRDAAEHLDFAIRNLAPRESAETLDKIKDGLQSAKQQVAELRLVASEPGAELLIDGERVGSAPLDRSLFADVGSHTLEARLGADRVAKQVVEAARGSAYTVELRVPEAETLEPDSGLSHAGPAPISRPDVPTASSRSLVPVYVGGGLVVAGLALGVGYRVAASSSQSDLDRLRERNGDTGCADASASRDCDAQRSAAQSVDSRRNVSTVSFVVAGAAAVATAVYWFWPRERSATAAHDQRVIVGASPAPGGGAVVLFGSF